MTKKDAIRYVRSSKEPASYAEAAEIFEALYGREPDAEDGDQFMVWSLCCSYCQ